MSAPGQIMFERTELGVVCSLKNYLSAPKQQTQALYALWHYDTVHYDTVWLMLDILVFVCVCCKVSLVSCYSAFKSEGSKTQKLFVCVPFEGNGKHSFLSKSAYYRQYHHSAHGHKLHCAFWDLEPQISQQLVACAPRSVKKVGSRSKNMQFLCPSAWDERIYYME